MQIIMADSITWTCIVEFILRLLRGVCGCHKQQLSSPSPPMREERECSQRHACAQKQQQRQHLMEPEPEVDMVG